MYVCMYMVVPVPPNSEAGICFCDRLGGAGSPPNPIISRTTQPARELNSLEAEVLHNNDRLFL